MNKNLCLLSAAALSIVGIVDMVMDVELGIVVLILSIVACLFSTSYSSAYKRSYGKSANGAGLITFGSAFNIIGGLFLKSFNTMGTILALIGTIMVLFNRR